MVGLIVMVLLSTDTVKKSLVQVPHITSVNNQDLLEINHGYRNIIRPCQIGILLSVRVRVGLGVLNPIKKANFVGEIFFNNFDVPGFRKNITILKL